VRIWHQGFIEMQTVPAYREALARHLALVAGAGVEVVIHGLRPGTYTPDASPADLARHAYLTALHEQQVVEAARRAEREGYDAVGIAIIQDIGVALARSVVDIPVAGYGESAMHLACLLGERFGVVAFNPDIFSPIRAAAHRCGLEGRIAAMVPMTIDYRDVVDAFARPGPLVDAFVAAAREAVRRGADAILPGQTIMAEVLHQSGVNRVDDAPVVDPVAAVIKTARTLAEMRAESGVSVARRGFALSRPPERLVEAARRAYGLDRAPLLED
jgi:Asp/Glu/hydantoin racemase